VYTVKMYVPVIHCKSALWLINCVIFNSFLVYKHEIEIQSICDECGKHLDYRQDGGRKT
jgi:hypothetical protein